MPLLFLALCSTPAPAEPRQQVIDRWSRLSHPLHHRGVTLETVNTLDVLSTVAGGLRRETATAGDPDLLLTLDAEKLMGWRGATVFLYGLDGEFMAGRR